MAYTLEALLARCEVFAELPAWAADAVVIPLAQGICMLPLGHTLLHRFGTPERPWEYARHGIFTHLPEGLLPDLLELSRAGRLAYVEAEFWAGEGEQRYVVWENGAVVDEPEESSMAINDALRRLGVQASEGLDRFDTVGLGRHRGVDDWLAEARRPPEPPPPPPAEPAPPPRPWWRFWG